jgi:asparagine synthase (glutamine-hydrolysing)
MCGFLGQFGGRINGDVQDDLIRLLHLSKSRGPDETAVYTNGKDLWMGFNRLAILDVSAGGSQPMRSHTGRYTIVFNGEIYNHLDLRDRLRFRNWRGHSDTETILSCIEEWGFETTIERLDGMFALAVYDHLEEALLCVRDFAGIKPFFYGWDDNVFVFASQYDQITRHRRFSANAIDSQVLRLYLEQHFMPAPYGLFEQTGQLEPGQWCKVSEVGLQKGFFWQFPEYTEPTVCDEQTAHELLESALSHSVSAEMLSDVPLGAFLSGGIDSPLVCHYAARNSTRPLKTFTIGSDSIVHDETHLANAYSDLIGTQHYLSTMQADPAIDLFDDAMACLREPIADLSIIPTHLVSRLARAHVTVALSGDGGDELFFGYERFWSVAKNIRFQFLPWVIKAAFYKADKVLTGCRQINGAVLAEDQAAAHRSLHSRFPGQWIDHIFPDLKDVSVPENYGTYNYQNTRNENELIQSMRKAEFYGMMQKTLRKVDLASMGVSLEVRVPFLKKTVIESVLKLDPLLSYGPNRKKQLLKSHLSKLYPTAPIDNKKRGFTVPFGKFLNSGVCRRRIMDALSGNEFRGRFHFDSGSVEELILGHSAEDDRKWPIFTMLALERFSRVDDIPNLRNVRDETRRVSCV